MTARSSSPAEPQLAPRPRWLDAGIEALRYLTASAAALAVDAGTYLGLIHFAGAHYLVAAPIGFALGLATVYFLSTRWVFSRRRLSDAKLEFAIFTAIGLLGLCLNQLILYVAVDGLALSPEIAKAISAALVFGFNFSARKLILFSRTA
jgi:putative flippase GtrA